MQQIIDHTKTFRQITQRVLGDMFGLTDCTATDIVEENSVRTTKTFMVSIYYTGTVYGEYLLAMDEQTAAAIIGMSIPDDEEGKAEVREMICDALSETLNMVVGESLVELQQSYAKLTLTAPRIYFGEIRYPQFRTGTTTLNTPMGEVECHFCLDLMRLDLATSYEQAMGSLLQVNSQLKDANRRLAAQQAQLVHSEKMASLGMLASGVAHEINNPLFFVDANLNTLCDYIGIIDTTLDLYENLCASVQGVTPELETQLETVKNECEQVELEFVMNDTKELMGETRDGVKRIKEIVQGLKEFSHVDVGGIVETDLNTIVENAYNLVARNLRDGCKLEMNLGGIPKIACNAGELGQVVVNLLLNAIHAVKEGGGIALSTEANDTEVTLCVRDTGRGIEQEHLDRIFEPFYTTKDEGEGKGLGLAIAYGIVKKHNGSISCESQAGKGTKVSIRLPLHPESVDVGSIVSA